MEKRGEMHTKQHATQLPGVLRTALQAVQTALLVMPLLSAAVWRIRWTLGLGNSGSFPWSLPPSPPPAMFDTKAELKSAVDEWIINATSASSVYGHISAWNTSRITDI